MDTRTASPARIARRLATFLAASAAAAGLVVGTGQPAAAGPVAIGVQTARSDQTPAENLHEFHCKLLGGRFTLAGGVSWCFYPDGSFTACYPEGFCVTVPPKSRTNATATAPTASGPVSAQRR